MKNGAVIKYSIYNSLKIISPFYITLLVLIALTAILKTTTGYSGGLSAWDILAIFACCGVVSCFKERFHFFLQNGYSRKTLFINLLICMLFTSLFLSVFDYGVTWLSGQGVLSYEALFVSLYSSIQPNVFVYILWHMCLSMAVFSIVFLLTVLFYRVGKFLRMIIFIVLPVILLVCLPMIEFLLPSLQLFEHMRLGIMWFLGICETLMPYNTVIASLVCMMITLSGAYVILRNLNLQKI